MLEAEIKYAKDAKGRTLDHLDPLVRRLASQLNNEFSGNKTDEMRSEGSFLNIDSNPRGGHYSQVNKPSKYLFSCPAFRSIYYNLIGSSKKRDAGMGKLLEDAAGMYLTRYLKHKPNTSMDGNVKL